MSSLIKNINLRAIAPILVVLAALLIAVGLVKSKPTIEKSEQTKILPAVQAMRIELTDTAVSVVTQGLVKPHKQIELASEIAGRVIWVSDTLIAGGKFGKSDPMVRIDSTDYQLRLNQASASNTRATVELEIAEKNYQRTQKLSKQNLTSASQLDDAYKVFKLAEASTLVAQADLEQASLNLQRTEVTAPFSGRVQKESIDEGTYISVGTPIATLYADEIVEVRLPIANEDLSYLNWPKQMRGTLSPDQSVKVDITSSYGGIDYSWQGDLVRVESEVDSATRLFHGVAVVENPEFEDIPPLTVGLFVNAEIAGRLYKDIAIIPRTALINGQVMIIDHDNRLQYRSIEIIRIQQESVLVGAGLKNGDLLCVNPPAVVVEGMQINPLIASANG